MRKFSLFTTLLLILSVSVVFSQDTFDDVRLFQNFFHDASITKTPYVDAGLTYASYDGGSQMNIGAQGGYGVNPDLEIGGGIGFLSYSPDKGDGQSGLSDLLISGRYRLPVQGLKAAAGGYVTLPIGEEKVFQNRLNFGFFGALRHPLNNGMVITATAGLDFLETITDIEFDPKTGEFEEKKGYDNSLRIAAGAIYPVNSQLKVVGEFMIRTEIKYMMLSGAVDYKLQGKGRVRGGLGLGLDDGAPDILLMASYLLPL